MTHPPFTGYTQDALTFLEELDTNNNRDWFEANRQRYDKHLVEPTLSLIQTVGEALQEEIPEIKFDTAKNGRGSLARIYRDIRFSKDKTPYNTYIRAHWWIGGKRKDSPGFGLRFDHQEVGIIAGMYGFDKTMLQAYRVGVADDKLGRQLEKAIASVDSEDIEIHGKHYKRVPREFDADHPRAELLKHNSLYAVVSGLDANQVKDALFADYCVEQFLKMAPVLNWLTKLK